MSSTLECHWSGPLLLLHGMKLQSNQQARNYFIVNSHAGELSIACVTSSHSRIRNLLLNSAFAAVGTPVCCGHCCAFIALNACTPTRQCQQRPSLRTSHMVVCSHTHAWNVMRLHAINRIIYCRKVKSSLMRFQCLLL
jgi:hypothetical protein